MRIPNESYADVEEAQGAIGFHAKKIYEDGERYRKTWFYLLRKQETNGD